MTSEEFNAANAAVAAWMKAERLLHRLSLAWLGCTVVCAMLDLPAWTLWAGLALAAACHAAVIAIFDRIDQLQSRIIARLEADIAAMDAEIIERTECQ